MSLFPTWVRSRGCKPLTKNSVELVYRTSFYDDTELVNKLTTSEKKIFWKVLGCDDNEPHCHRGIYRDLDYGGLWIPMWDDNTEAWLYHYCKEVN